MSPGPRAAPVSESTISLEPESTGRTGASSGVETRSRVPPSLPTLTSRTGVPVVILSAALVRPAVGMDATCGGTDVVRAKAVPPTATAATATTTATMTRPRVNKPDIPRTVPP